MMGSTKKEFPEFWKSYEASFKNGLSHALNKVSFVVLDTETTGFDLKHDRILSIGALRIQNGQILAKEAFEVFIEQEKFNTLTVAIHGIRRKGSTQKHSELYGLRMLLQLLENAILVAHHVGFDVGMINQALKRNGLPKLKNKTLDTAVLYNRSLRRSERKTEGHFTLDELAEEFQIATTDRHTALGDAYITAIALLRIINRIQPNSTQELLKRNRLFGLFNGLYGFLCI